MNLSPLPIQKFFANNGRPLVGGKLFTYVAGTTTKVATYIDSTGVTQNTNPIILDFRGECRLWIDPQRSYKFTLSPEDDTDPPTNPIWTVDNITAAPQAFDNAAVDTGSVNNISLSIPQISSPVAFTRIVFQAANTNTGATTLQINGGIARPVIDEAGNAMTGGEITDNGIYQAVYDGGNWQLQWQLKFPRTAAEVSASMVPLNYAYPPGDSRRMALDPNGVTDCTNNFQLLLDAAGLAASNGNTQEVILYPGEYKVRRLFLHYSNVWLRIMPGATIIQTRTGITDSITPGDPPNYAVIHVNPLGYVVSPSSGAAGTIDNVRIYGGGTIKGPYTTDGAYDQFSQGVVSNDCHRFVIDGVKIMNCRAENILINPSSWFTTSDVGISNCEVEQGGEVGINNSRNFFILNNYIHDAWLMNGLGGNGDGGIVAFNRVINMPNSGMTFGGSGAADVGQCRDVIYAHNRIHATGQDNTGTFAVTMIDDGATTVPKNNLKFIGNIITEHTGDLMVGCDYTSGFITIEDNIISGLSGTDPTMWAVISGGATYHLKDNEFMLGSGNAVRCVDRQSGTATIILDEGNYYDPLIATSIQGVADFTIIHQYNSSFTGTLTGCTTSPTGTFFYSLQKKQVTLFIPSVTGTSNATTATFTGLPSWLVPIRNQNFIIPIQNNGGAPAMALIQISTTGVINLFSDINGAAFAAVNTKGTVGPYPITYILN